MKILIADDSGTARMFTKRCLEISGLSKAEYTEVINGKEAYESAGKNPVDLIVADLIMPVMDGEELIRRIKTDEKTKLIPIMIVTSAKNPAREAQLKELGAFAVLSKPISPAILRQTLKSVFATQIA